jgi:hypothetical protein
VSTVDKLAFPRDFNGLLSRVQDFLTPGFSPASAADPWSQIVTAQIHVKLAKF